MEAQPVLKMYLPLALIKYCDKKKGVSMEKDKHLGLRIDSETHKKLKNLADYEGRSINGQVLYLIRQAIAKHEHDNGPL